MSGSSQQSCKVPQGLLFQRRCSSGRTTLCNLGKGIEGLVALRLGTGNRRFELRYVEMRMEPHASPEQVAELIS
jgi:hypothetical protein